jgi:hypothetical protein
MDLLTFIASGLTAPPGRLWLESLPWLAPSPLATRWLLLADLAVIAALTLRSRWPLLVLPSALVGGFLVLNGLGMLLTDFFLGLLAFHALTAIAALVAGGRLSWLGVALLALTLLLGLAT